MDVDSALRQDGAAYASGGSAVMLVVVILVALALGVLFWRGWSRPVLKRGEWRAGAGLLSIGTLMAAAFLAVRANWEMAIALAVVGAVLMVSARTRRGPYKVSAPQRPQLTADEARSLLGVDPDASPEDVRAAYGRLIRKVHPDAGGSTGLAAQLNAARDRLLER
ncbi:MAG: J domain-containing protein [Phenylobacterium sp.]